MLNFTIIKLKQKYWTKFEKYKFKEVVEECGDEDNMPDPRGCGCLLYTSRCV